MRYSQFFGKTNKSIKEYDSANATFLIRGGYIDQTMAGVYTFLPLGLRVLTKIENIVREEMNKIGNELLMPALAPQELWEKTNRLAAMDVLFKATGANEISERKNNAAYILNPTHEELITPIAKKFNISHKDLPFAVYQIQNKFRNEVRPKSGIMRTREFRMKDLYSFHKNLEDLMGFYETAKQSYTTIFERLGLGEITFVALASGGDFTQNYSHEFQTKCETGEDLIFHDYTTGVYYNREVAPSKAPYYEQETELKPAENVYGENIISVEKLVDFLKIPIEKCVKTILYKDNEGNIYAAAVRGDYEVNELKIQKILEGKKVSLLSDEDIKDLTGAEVGYAGIKGLPQEVRIICDDSLENMTNFEVGANKTNYHTINANWDRDIKRPDHFYDIKLAKEGDLIPGTDKKMGVFKAAEVGNIFPLETKFSTAFEYYYTDDIGEQKIVYMGSYGIGTSRLLAVLAEVFHDENGILWPESVAPFKVHLIGLGFEEAAIKERAFELYDLLLQSGVEVLFDDRENVGAGEKFADADLIGCPYRVVVSKRTGAQVEFKKRNEDTAKLVSVEELLELLKS